jgi:hypothetical protein
MCMSMMGGRSAAAGGCGRAGEPMATTSTAPNNAGRPSLAAPVEELRFMSLPTKVGIHHPAPDG